MDTYIFILLQTNGLGNVLTITDIIFPLYLKRDINLRMKDVNMETDMHAVK